MSAPSAVLTDIEGTTTPIAFVRDVLFPYARARLPAFVAAHAADPAIATELAEARRLSEGRDPVEALLGWMDADAKITPLKTLQGLIWNEGYQSGALQGALYPDVAPCLRAWRAAGVRLYVYSSGSEAAQRLIFAHSADGDLSGLFGGFFDTNTGGKREPASYRAIASRTAIQPAETLFLSDVEAELDAAGAAGFSTCQLVRTEDATIRCGRHQAAADFAEVAQKFGLP